ncbi:hypothetical protein SFGR64A_24900 (plasmid) [Sinorhizobium fredii GR64]|uniref:hypothetical protein n=1 Tax=Rhizobium fredii TaxID=380 RepID=UPI000694ACB5|nr:hypothetical protein [Sinorhizobium fredii]WOS64802.1 hypothetical protein SFGR64A_24900 [Sinorhizobium fredii GR64]
MTGKLPPGVVHHSDRGSQYAAELYRETLAANGLIGSMGRGAELHEKAERRGVFPMSFETFQDITEYLPLHRTGLQQTPAPFSARLLERPTVRGSTHPADRQISSLIPVHPKGRTPRTGHI